MVTTAPRFNSLILGLMLALAAALMVLSGAVTSARAFTVSPADVFINEIHYDNAGTDANEAIEIAGPAGTDLSGWSLVLYNGANGQVYDTDALSGVIPDQQNGFGTLLFTYPVNGIQNGSPDGVALVNGTTLVQFLSYEGSFTAVGGPANGVASTDIGVTETGLEPLGQSLQLQGSGSIYQDFTWAGPFPSSPGAVNAGQTFQPSANAPIVTTCPTELITTAGTPAMAEISATDSDSTVNTGAITNGGVVGITLDGFIPAPGDGGMAEATLQVSDAVEAGIYQVAITFGNDDGQSGSCAVAVMVAMPAPIYEIQGPTTDLNTLTSPLERELVATEGVVTVVLGQRLLPTRLPSATAMPLPQTASSSSPASTPTVSPGRPGADIRHCDRVSAQRSAE